MDAQPETWSVGSFANTAPTGRPTTSPVVNQSYYQPPGPMAHPMPGHHVPPFIPPKSRSPIAWILGFIGIAGFVVIILAVMFVARSGRRGVDLRAERGGPTETARSGEIALGPATADRIEPLGNETALVKSVTLSPDARVVVRGLNGSITITTWNKPEAEIRSIKKGNPDEGPQTFIRNDRGNLSIRTASGRRNSDVRYEIKLPQSVEDLQVESENAGIKISDITGDKIRIKTRNGTIDLANIIGELTAETTNGAINAQMGNWHDEELSFSTVNGPISLQLKGDEINAELEASAVSGAISIDDKFGITVERQPGSQRAEGAIGNGGAQVRLKTVNGSIRVSRVEGK
jgi:hypothetical protein